MRGNGTEKIKEDKEPLPPPAALEIRVLVEDKTDKCPFEEWLHRLRDKAARLRILSRLDLVQTGNMGDMKPVGEGVHELRVDYGPGYRVYFVRVGATIVLLLIGGDKGTQSADIVKAKAMWKDAKGNGADENKDIGRRLRR